MDTLLSTCRRALRLDASQRTVTKAQPAISADLNGIAKGYGVDRAAQALEALGIEHYLVEAGGEVRARGINALDSALHRAA